MKEALKLQMNTMVSARGKGVIFPLGETLVNVKKSRAVRFAGKSDQYRSLSSRNRALMTREKERNVTSLLQGEESCGNANDFRPVCLAIEMLSSEPPSHANVSRTAGRVRNGYTEGSLH